MQKNTNEKIILDIIEKYHPKGIGVNQIATLSRISKSTTIKALNHLVTIGLINYPPQKRGKRTLITLKDTSFDQLFKKIRKQAKGINAAHADSPPFFVNDIYGDVYCGHPDDYESRILVLYNVHRFNHKTRKWIPLPKRIEGQGFDWFEIDLSEIDSIYIPNLINLGLEQISLDDAMSLWTSPNHIIQHSIKCDWRRDPFTPHSKFCDGEVNEILTELYTKASIKDWDDLVEKFPKEYSVRNKKHEEFGKKFSKLIDYIIKHNGKIPRSNF